MPIPKSWSYSSLTQFEDCPRRYQKQRVTKEVVDTGNEYSRDGQRVHKAFELFVKKNKPLPDDLKKFERLAQLFVDFDGDIYTEQPLAVNSNLEPVFVAVNEEGEPLWPEDAWCKCIVDVLAIKGSRAYACDYKTGKPHPESTQLMLNAALVFAAFPQVDRVDTSFLWLKSGKTTDGFYLRENLWMIWMEFLPRVKRIATAIKTEVFVPMPSGLCGYCPCTKVQCQYAEKEFKDGRNE